MEIWTCYQYGYLKRIQAVKILRKSIRILNENALSQKENFLHFLMLVVFPSNDFHRKPQHVAILSLNQQLVLTEISLTGCSESYIMGLHKQCLICYMCDGHTKQKLLPSSSGRCQTAVDDGCVTHTAEHCLQINWT